MLKFDSFRSDFRLLPVECWDSTAHLRYCPATSLRPVCVCQGLLCHSISNIVLTVCQIKLTWLEKIIHKAWSLQNTPNYIEVLLKVPIDWCIEAIHLPCQTIKITEIKMVIKHWVTLLQGLSNSDTPWSDHTKFTPNKPDGISIDGLRCKFLLRVKHLVDRLPRVCDMQYMSNILFLKYCLYLRW